QPERWAGYDHPTALRLQPLEPADRNGDRSALQHLRDFRHDQDEPVLRSGGHRAREDRPLERDLLPREFNGSLLGQRGLPEVHGTRGRAFPPRRSEDLVLKSVSNVSFGAASAAPFFMSA